MNNDYEIRQDEKGHLVIRGENNHPEGSMLLRTHGKKVKRMTGADYTVLEKNVYLLGVYGKRHGRDTRKHEIKEYLPVSQKLYEDDIKKASKKYNSKVSAIFENIPGYLSTHEKKVILKRIKGNSFSEYDESLREMFSDEAIDRLYN